jgi:UrcA family protein
MSHKHLFWSPGRIRCPEISTTASLQLALVALAFALPGNAAQNDNKQGSQVTIQADHEVHKRPAGMTYTGIPIEEVSLSRKVGVSDLDLSSPAGRAELDKRIEAVAKEACKQLEKLYPLEDWVTDTDTCIANAIKGAKKQEQALLASAGRK